MTMRSGQLRRGKVGKTKSLRLVFAGIGFAQICKLRLWVLLSVLCAGCSVLPLGYRYSLAARSVEGNLAGPYMPTRAVSPTEITAVIEEGGVQSEVVLELRGVVSPPDGVVSNEVTKWLRHKMAYFEDEGLFVLKDTLIDLGSNRVKGVVLYPLERSVLHDVETGRAVTLASSFGIVQCDALELGKLLHERDPASFSWDRDFARFQQEARRDRLGYWAVPGRSQ